MFINCLRCDVGRGPVVQLFTVEANAALTYRKLADVRPDGFVELGAAHAQIHWSGSRELEKLRGVDRSQSAGEIDAERDINEQLTNDLLTVETERDHLKAENAGLNTGYAAYEQVVQGLKAENEALRKSAERYQWLRDKQTFIWLIQDWFPKDNVLTDVDAEIDAAMIKEASHG